MSEHYANSYQGSGAPTLSGMPTGPAVTQGEVPPPPAAAPLVSPTLPGLPAMPSAAVAPGAVPDSSSPAPALPTLPGSPPAPAPPTMTPTDDATAIAPASATVATLDLATAAPSIPMLPGSDAAVVPTPAAPVPTLESASPSPAAPDTSPALIDAPVLPPVGMPATTPASDDVVKFGLPTASPTTAPSEVPEWKRRQNSKGRKFAKRLVQLAVLGALGAGGWFVYQSQLASTDEPAPPATTIPAAPAVEPAVETNSGVTGVIDRTDDVVEELNDQAPEAELVDQLDG